MAEPVGAALDAVITKAQAVLQDVRLVRREERPSRSLIDFEGRWSVYRIIVSEIHVADGSVRYAYYVLDTVFIVWCVRSKGVPRVCYTRNILAQVATAHALDQRVLCLHCWWGACGRYHAIHRQSATSLR